MNPNYPAIIAHMRSKRLTTLNEYFLFIDLQIVELRSVTNKKQIEEIRKKHKPTRTAYLYGKQGRLVHKQQLND